MRTKLFTLILIGVSSCSNNTYKKQAVDTTNRIIVDLRNQDSANLHTLFVVNGSISKRHVEIRAENIIEGYKLASEYSPLGTTSYKIRVDTITASVYSVEVEVPFIDTLTKNTKGKITVVFENFYGFDKAESISVINYDYINSQYLKNTNNGNFDTTNIEIDTAMILRGIRQSNQKDK